MRCYIYDPMTSLNGAWTNSLNFSPLAGKAPNVAGNLTGCIGPCDTVDGLS